MRTRTLPVAAALAVALVGCGDPEPDRPITTEGWPDPVVTTTTQQVPLRDVAGAGMAGNVIITPFGDSVVFHVNLTDAAPDRTYPVRVMEGSCEAPGGEFAVLEAVFTGPLGDGRSQRALTEEPQRVLGGMHHVAVFAPAARIGQDRAAACAQIPAMQNVAGQLLPEQPQAGRAAPGQPGQPGLDTPAGPDTAQPGADTVQPGTAQPPAGQTPPGQ